MSDTTHSFASAPSTFTVAFPAADVADLWRRLETARWPAVDSVPGPEQGEDGGPPKFGLGWGPTLPLMKELCKEWKDDYSLDVELKRINSFPNYKVTIEDLSIHFIHQRSSHPNAIPIILCHGWPGFFVEFLDVIELLVNPPEGQQAFHVVVPSMPGFTFSDPPRTSKWRMDDTARVFDKLMTGLGYSSYAAQGGDWGSITARCLGALHPTHCLAVHLNFCPATGPGFGLTPPRKVVEWLPRFILSDVEKMVPFIDQAAKTQSSPTLTRNTLFSTCTLYYLTGCIGTSFLPYTLNPYFPTFLRDPKYFLPNFAMSVFPFEIAITPERFVARTGVLGWFKEAKDGGHFAATDNPVEFVSHLREALGEIWPSSA
ncbi:hypothetical protein RQP46_007653 [Phenoliferia psychrophenolica]